MHPSRNTSDPTWEDFACFGGELGEVIGIRVNDFLDLDVVTTTWEAAVGLPEIDEALFGFRFHDVEREEVNGGLAQFPVHRAALKEWIVFHLLKTTGSADALLVAGGDVAGSRPTFGFGFRAL